MPAQDRDYIDLPFPVKGLYDTHKGDGRPALTTEVMVNTPVRNPRTGEYTGARRAGTEKWVSERIGDGPVRGLIQVRYDERQTIYEAITSGGDLNIEWSRSVPAKESSQRVEVDRAGNVFALSGPTAVVKVNPDGEVVGKPWEIPVTHKDQRIGVLIVDEDDSVYVATSQGPQGAVPKIWKYAEQEDGSYQIEWALEMDGYVPDACIKNGILYVLENVASKPLENGLPSNVFGVAYLSVFDSLGASEPRQLWYRAVPFPTSMVRVNNAGVIYIACGPNAQRGTNTGDLCSPHAVWWTPSELSGASNRIWTWLAADDLASGIGSLSKGDPVVFWRDRSGNGRHLHAASKAGISPPTYEPAGFCDLPVIRFNGENGLETSDTSMSNAENSTTSNLSLIPSVDFETFTIFMVLAPRVGSSNRQCVFEQWGEAKYRIIVNEDENGDYAPDKIRLFVDPVEDAGADQPLPGSIDAAVAPTGYRDDAVVLAFRMGGDGTSEASWFRINGVEVDRFTIDREQIRYASFIGHSQHPEVPHDGTPYEGDIAEILTIRDVGGAISDADVERIEGYLANKWGIRHVLGGSGSGSGSHPYRDAPPSGSGSASVPEVEDPWATTLSSTLGIVMALSPNAGEIRWADANSGMGDVLAINDLEDDGLVFCHGKSTDTGSGHGSTATASGDQDITTRMLRDENDGFSYVWARSDLAIPRSTYFTRALMVGGAVYLPGHFQTDVTSLWKLDADTGDTIWTWDTDPIQRVSYDIAMPPAKDYGVDGLEDPEFFYLVSFQGGPGSEASTLWKVRNVSKTVIDGNPRASAVYASSDGDVRRVIPGASPEVATATGGAGTLQDSRFVRGVQLFGELFINDGGNLFVVTPRTNVMVPYVPRTGGERLANARLLAAWRGALVEARPDDAPNQWQMSRRGDPYDQNRFPPVRGDAQAAILGSDSRAGLFPDLINAIIPVTDDFCLFGGDVTIQRLTGDPMAAGVFDVIEPNVGIAFGYAWCIGPSSEVYFFSTQAEVRVLTVGSASVELSKEISTRVRRAADLTQTTPILAYDTAEECLHVLFAPLNGEPETPTIHFRWEKRANAWSETTFANPGHEPTSVCVLDGDDPEDRRLLIGCQDGYIRSIDRLAADDDGTAIDARVLIGPGMHPQFGQKIRLYGIKGEFHRDGGDVTWRLYRANSPQEVPDTPKHSGTFGPGVNPTQLARASASAIWLELASSAENEWWGFERAKGRIAPTGRDIVHG